MNPELRASLDAFCRRWKFFIADGRPEQIREDLGRAGLIKIVKHELWEAMLEKGKPQTARQYWENIAKEYGSIEDLPCLGEECER